MTLSEDQARAMGKYASPQKPKKAAGKGKPPAAANDPRATILTPREGASGRDAQGPVILQPYRTESWHGRPNYCCNLCAFSTTRREVMSEHLETEHVGGKTA